MMTKNDIGRIIDNINRNQPEPDTKDAIIKADGSVICPHCGHHLKMWLKAKGMEPRLVNCTCHCSSDLKEKADKLNKEEKHRKDAFGKRTDIMDASFDKDKGYQPEVSKKLMAYVDHFDEIMKGDTIGFVLAGSFGTGKTYLASATINEMIKRDPSRSALFTSISEIEQHWYRKTKDDEEFMEKLTSVTLLVLDDVGAERETTVAKERTFTVINDRINAHKALIITTNIKRKDMASQKDINDLRIINRYLQALDVLEVEGKNIRAMTYNERIDRFEKTLKGDKQ